MAAAARASETALTHPVPTQPLPVHLLDGPTADLQALGQVPLAHSLRPLCPDVLPLPHPDLQVDEKANELAPYLPASNNGTLLYQGPVVGRWPNAEIAYSHAPGLSDEERHARAASFSTGIDGSGDVRFKLSPDPHISCVNGGGMLGHWGGVKLYHLVCSCSAKKSELTGQHKCPHHLLREMACLRVGQQRTGRKVLMLPILREACLEFGRQLPPCYA